MTTQKILSKIAALQETQSLNKPSSKVWEDASIELNKLFTIMAKRAKQ